MGDDLVMKPAAHWWLTRQARTLGVSADALIHACEVAHELERRANERWYCESCGRRVMDFNRTDDAIRPYVFTEDGCYVCVECAGSADENRWDVLGREA